MKVAILLVCACAVVFSVRGVQTAAIEAPLHIISLDDITESERKTLEFLDKLYARPKRSGGSGSGGSDLFSAIKATIGQGIKNKLGMIAKGSASASSHFSSGSSGGGEGHSYHHHVPETYDHKSFDFWSLKKSILNTLLQAVKAIKGGVIAIKGQLIKGSGYLISAKGKLISTKGEAISSLGKHIASTAILSPSQHGYSSHGHDGYVVSHGSGHHHSSEEYGAPSAPGPEFEVPDHYHHSHHGGDHNTDDGPHGGILIIKKIPGHGHDHSSGDHHEHHDHDDHYHHDHDDHKIPDFKPLEPSGPSFGTIVGKFFSASTSLKAGEPAPFGYTSPGHDSHQYSDSHVEHASDDHHHGHHHNEEHHNHDQHHETGDGGHHDYPPAHSSHNSQPPSTSYGSPFEESPGYSSQDEYTSDTKHSPLKVDPIKPSANPPVHYQSAIPQHFDEIRPLSAYGYNQDQFNALKSSQLPTYDEIKAAPNTFANPGFSSSTSLLNDAYDVNLPTPKQNESFPPYAEQHALKSYLPAPASSPPSGPANSNNFGGFRNPGSHNIKYLAAPPPDASGDFSFSSHPGFNGDIRHAGSQKVPVKIKPRVRPPWLKHHKTHQHHSNPNKKPPSSYNIVRSISFELGPNGPKRL